MCSQRLELRRGVPVLGVMGEVQASPRRGDKNGREDRLGSGHHQQTF